MTVKEIYDECVNAIVGHQKHGLIGPCRIGLIKPAKIPKGFPKGDFVSETHKGKLYSYSAAKVFDFLVDSGVADCIKNKTHGWEEE